MSLPPLKMQNQETFSVFTSHMSLTMGKSSWYLMFLVYMHVFNIFRILRNFSKLLMSEKIGNKDRGLEKPR